MPDSTPKFNAERAIGRVIGEQALADGISLAGVLESLRATLASEKKLKAGVRASYVSLADEVPALLNSLVFSAELALRGCRRASAWPARAALAERHSGGTQGAFSKCFRLQAACVKIPLFLFADFVGVLPPRCFNERAIGAGGPLRGARSLGGR